MARLATIVAVGLCAFTTGAIANEVGSRKASELARFVRQDCGSCHGLTLQGGLGGNITAELMRHYDRETLRDIILDGLPGTAMPPWRALLSEAEAMWIADFLRQEKDP